LVDCQENLKPQKEELARRTIPKPRKPFQQLTSDAKRKRKTVVKNVLQTILEDVREESAKVHMTFSLKEKEQFIIDIGGAKPLSSQEAKEKKRKELLAKACQILRVKDKFRLPYKALRALRSKVDLKELVPPEHILQSETLRLATCLDIIPLNTVSILSG
jgi:hypothetical protein